MGKIIKIIALLALLPAFAYAAGDTGADVLKERAGGRAVALGEAYTALGDDVESANYNPAGIASIVKREAEISWNVKYAGMNVFYGAFAQPLETFILEGYTGLSAVYRSMPEIDNEDAVDAPVNYYDAAITGTYACNLWQFIKEESLKNLSLGISAKIATEQMGTYTGTFLAFDAGVLLNLKGTGLRLGASLLNAGLQLASEKAGSTLTKSPLPLTARAGAAYKIIVDEKNSTQFSLDYAQDFYDYGRFGFGLEHNLVDILFLRAGYNMAVDTRSPAVISAGAGINVTATTPVEITVGLNYTYRLYMWSWMNSPDSLHSFSGVFKF